MLMIYTLLTIFKVVVSIVGLAFTLLNFFPGIWGDKPKLRKAGLIFGGTWLILILLTVIEFGIFFSKR